MTVREISDQLNQDRALCAIALERDPEKILRAAEMLSSPPTGKPT